MQNLRTIFFVVEKRKRGVRKYKSELIECLDGIRITEIPEPENADCIVVLGGDGTMLGAIRQYQSLHKPFLGINFGRRGFYMNDRRVDVTELLRQGDFKVSSFPLLEMEIETKEGAMKDYTANDVYVKPVRSAGSCILNVSVDGILFFEKMLGDGVVVSTALGSTAYNLSAGGPAIDASLEVLALAPICPHTPVQVKPIVVGSEAVITIEVIDPENRRVLAACGAEYADVRRVTVRQARKRFQLVLLGKENFAERLVRRIMKAR